MTGRRLGILTRAGLGLALGAGAVAVSTFQAPAGAQGVLLLVLSIWRPLFAAPVSRDLAIAEDEKPDRVNFIFMILTL